MSLSRSPLVSPAATNAEQVVCVFPLRALIVSTLRSHRISSRWWCAVSYLCVFRPLSQPCFLNYSSRRERERERERRVNLRGLIVIVRCVASARGPAPDSINSPRVRRARSSSLPSTASAMRANEAAIFSMPTSLQLLPTKVGVGLEVMEYRVVVQDGV
jgi:hypothetical protein